MRDFYSFVKQTRQAAETKFLKCFILHKKYTIQTSSWDEYTVNTRM